ncbi:rhodanese-like domain-containing protein [Pontibacter sp. 172403-2]|nr:rhodanese-like domain-containing protein [Pontibacter sp. 172403-2]MBF9254188.1 rhodanese-like domain-containing protein [Pontibacter sp. 172403-2]
MQKKLYLVAALCCLLLMQACGQSSGSAYHLMLKGIYKDNFPLIKPAQLAAQLQQSGGPKPLLLDIRTPAEFRVSHIKGARFVNADKFDLKQVQDIPKDTPIVVYCSVGARSQKIGEELKEAGYHQVQNLYGGLFEWVNEGYPVYNRQGRTNRVHAYSKTWGVWLQKGEKVYD